VTLEKLTLTPVAADIFREAVVTVKDTDSIDAAARALLAWRFPSVPVQAADGSLVGMLADVDCMRTLSDALRYGWPIGRVADVMTAQVTTVARDADLMTLVEVFAQNHFNSVPVTEAGTLVGVVSRRDVLSALSKLVAART